MLNMLKSFFGKDADNIIVDPHTGLTEYEKQLVQKTWAEAIAHEDLPVDILETFLRRHRDYQKYFQAFHDVPLENLRSNKKFRAHATSVTNALQNVVDALNDIGLLEATLVSLGDRHGKRGQKPQHFLDLQKVILDQIKEVCGDNYTSEVETAWLKAFEAVQTLICKGLNKTS